MYEENTKVVLKESGKLIKELQGKTVITSDHGEMLGERSFPLPIKQFGHPAGIYVTELVNVPWLIISEGQRKITKGGSLNENEVTVNSDVEKHLENLGYK